MEGIAMVSVVEISWAAAYKIPIHSLFALPDILEDTENGLPPLARETLNAGYEKGVSI
jgi:hypothetical protein